MKVCKKCRIEQGPEAFRPERNSCRSCDARYVQEWRARNPKRNAELKKSFAERNPAKAQAWKRKWYLANRATVVKEYRERNRERIAEAARAWQRSSEGKMSVVASSQRRRARKRGVGGNYSKADIDGLLARQGCRCVYCHAKLKLSGRGRFHVDHIYPIALGGSNDASNIQLTCPTCNLAKSAKDPIAFAQEIGKLL